MGLNRNHLSRTISLAANVKAWKKAVFQHLNHRFWIGFVSRDVVAAVELGLLEGLGSGAVSLASGKDAFLSMAVVSNGEAAPKGCFSENAPP